MATTRISGNLAVSGSTLTINGATALTAGQASIVNADISTSAAIALSKLAALATHDRVLVSSASGVISESSVTSTTLAFLDATSSIQTQLGNKISSSEKGANNGVASLDSGGKVPVAQLPNSIMEYQGTYDPTGSAGAGVPALANGTGNTGDVYRVTVAGSHDFGAGSITLVVGDYVIYNGTIYERAHSGADAVISVNGASGAVSLTTADVPASTNKNYVTDAQQTVIGNTSGTNTGDNAVNSLYSGLVSNATHTGDATGATALTVVAINGQNLAALSTGILKNTTTTGVPSIAIAADFPTLNQNTTGTAANITDTSNSSLTTLSSLSLPYSQLSGTVPTWNQNTSGSAASLSATLAITSGGTGQTTANAALNALLPSQGSNNGKALTTNGTNTTWTTVPLSNTGDIEHTSFSASASQTDQAVTGFLFANADVRSFSALVSVTTATLFEVFEVIGVQKASIWDISYMSTGDASGYSFSISNSGQVQYTSSSEVGGATIKFRARTTLV